MENFYNYTTNISHLIDLDHEMYFTCNVMDEDKDVPLYNYKVKAYLIPWDNFSMFPYVTDMCGYEDKLFFTDNFYKRIVIFKNGLYFDVFGNRNGEDPIFSDLKLIAVDDNICVYDDNDVILLNSGFEEQIRFSIEGLIDLDYYNGLIYILKEDIIYVYSGDTLINTYNHSLTDTLAISVNETQISILTINGYHHMSLGGIYGDFVSHNIDDPMDIHSSRYDSNNVYIVGTEIVKLYTSNSYVKDNYFVEDTELVKNSETKLYNAKFLYDNGNVWVIDGTDIKMCNFSGFELVETSQNVGEIRDIKVFVDITSNQHKLLILNPLKLVVTSNFGDITNMSFTEYFIGIDNGVMNCVQNEMYITQKINSPQIFKTWLHDLGWVESHCTITSQRTVSSRYAWGYYTNFCSQEESQYGGIYFCNPYPVSGTTRIMEVCSNSSAKDDCKVANKLTNHPEVNPIAVRTTIMRACLNAMNPMVVMNTQKDNTGYAASIIAYPIENEISNHHTNRFIQEINYMADAAFTYEQWGRVKDIYILDKEQGVYIYSGMHWNRLRLQYIPNIQGYDRIAVHETDTDTFIYVTNELSNTFDCYKRTGNLFMFMKVTDQHLPYGIPLFENEDGMIHGERSINVYPFVVEGINTIRIFNERGLNASGRPVKVALNHTYFEW